MKAQARKTGHPNFAEGQGSSFQAPPEAGETPKGVLTLEQLT